MGVCEVLKDIQSKGEVTRLKRGFDPDQTLPDNRSFFTYLGSLTTPPLFESVTWIVFEEPVEISKEQLSAMRAICTSDSCDDLMLDNYRPPCSQGERRVRRSHMVASKPSSSTKISGFSSFNNSSDPPEGVPCTMSSFSLDKNLIIIGGCALALAVIIPISIYVKRKL